MVQVEVQVQVEAQVQVRQDLTLLMIFHCQLILYYKI